MPDNLAGFIKTIEDTKLLDFNILGENDENFNNRLKIQRFVYLARYFGMDMKYDYNMYLRGPYSQQLAWDYYSLAENREKYENAKNLPIPDRFLKVIGDKDIEWLEIASTLISLNESFKDRESLSNRTANMKRISRQTIHSILKELENLKLISF
jgi:uncharacterized protein YwgA